jgi:hypothetical protein
MPYIQDYLTEGYTRAAICRGNPIRSSLALNFEPSVLGTGRCVVLPFDPEISCGSIADCLEILPSSRVDLSSRSCVPYVGLLDD